MTIKIICLELEEEEAVALAQMAKRFGHHHAVELSSKFTRYGDREEHDVMLDGVIKLQRALAGAGHAPR